VTITIYDWSTRREEAAAVGGIAEFGDISENARIRAFAGGCLLELM